MNIAYENGNILFVFFYVSVENRIWIYTTHPRYN